MHGHAMNVLEDLSVELVQGHSGYVYTWDKLCFCWLASFSVLTEITKFYPLMCPLCLLFTHSDMQY